MHSSEYEAAKAKYARIRQRAFAETAREAVESGLYPSEVRLTDLDEHALAVWRRTWLAPQQSGDGGWDWDEVSRPFRKDPSAFHLAIWSGRVLNGLATGRVAPRPISGRDARLVLHFIEGAPVREHAWRGKIAPLVVAAGAAYARSLGISALRIANPLPGALAIYQNLGFSVVMFGERVVYCERVIGG